ncbi:hypothetical protein [Bradyrhizobium sp. Leo121]|uniref:hypothetical protein n=1 Tax=Bradyrhizobium sp. Leo121 TaxID=1571195 RepID=UPI001028DAA5|nr:hypothetical protein [Bradyrhizobium sp. Leo121]RZN24786.1 hypothetical protein CWO90_28520 [Bradyrhizobium sp. Leo121]
MTIQIESDGTQHGTRINVGDADISPIVTSITWSHGGGDGPVATVRLGILDAASLGASQVKYVAADGRKIVSIAFEDGLSLISTFDPRDVSAVKVEKDHIELLAPGPLRLDEAAAMALSRRLYAAATELAIRNDENLSK